MIFHTKSNDDSKRQLCARLDVDIKRDEQILRVNFAEQPVLERELRDAGAELRATQQALEHARALADAANMVSILPLGRVGRLFGEGVSVLTGINAANEADRLQRNLAQSNSKIANLDRQLANVNRLIAQHQRLRDQSMTARINNGC